MSSECVILSKSLLIKILMLSLRSLDLGVAPSVNFLNLDLSSRSLPLFQCRTSASLIGYVDQGGGEVKVDLCDLVNSAVEWNPDRGPGFA